MWGGGPPPSKSPPPLGQGGGGGSPPHCGGGNPHIYDQYFAPQARFFVCGGGFEITPPTCSVGWGGLPPQSGGGFFYSLIYIYIFYLTAHIRLEVTMYKICSGNSLKSMIFMIFHVFPVFFHTDPWIRGNSILINTTCFRIFFCELQDVVKIYRERFTL